MSKITFRADDDLVRQLEAFDASKSEVMRDALRTYLDEHGASSASAVGNEPPRADAEAPEGTVDELIAERVDGIVAERLAELPRHRGAQDVNVNITLEGAAENVSTDADRGAVGRGAATAGDTEESTGDEPAEETPEECVQCGEELSPSAVYCPNCGEKANHRTFCECGDEIRSDWAFCPSCGRRTPAANVLHDT